MAPRYKLTLRKLDFVSVVDEPAQPNAKCLLIKRARRGDHLEGAAKFIKASDELGLAFFWAFTSTNPDGSDHHDLQGDAIAADDAMIKACAEFMASGGPSDQQHDSLTVGKTVFGMPMTPEIAAAYGVVTKTSGFMVAIKVSKDVLAKLKSGEYTGVSIAGLGERTPVGKRVRKMAILTSVTDGHQHSIDLDDPACPWIDMLSTSSQTAEGATMCHSHAWVHDMTTGAVTVAADSGHTHTVSDVVPADVLAACAAIMADDEEDIAAIPAEIAAEPSDGIPAAVADEESSGVTVVVVQASASGVRNSPQPDPLRTVKNMKPIVLTETQHAHYSKLVGEDADAFLAKTAGERDAIVKAALDADPVVYKTASGMEIRKSAGEVAVNLAKTSDEQAKTIAAQQTDIAKAREERETAILKAAVAKDVGALPGAEADKVALLKSIHAEPDAAKRDAQLAIVKAGNAALAMLNKTNGTSEAGADAATDKKGAYAALEKGLTAFAKANNIPAATLWTDGLDAFTKTDEGAELRRTHDAFVAAGK